MLKIGINDKLILEKVEAIEKDNKLAIDFHFKDSSVTVTEMNPFSVNTNSEGYAVTGNGTSTLKVWPPQVADAKKFDGTARTQDEIANDTLTSILDFKNLFIQFAKCFTTSENINFDNYLRSTVVTPENWKTALPDENVIKIAAKNIVADFNEVVKGCLGVNDKEYLLRVICVRQSAAKPFPAFRRNFIAEYPVVENAIIDIAKTKLGFTKYEITKGLNTDAPVQAATDPVPADDLNASAVFGAGAAPQDAASVFTQQ